MEIKKGEKYLLDGKTEVEAVLVAPTHDFITVSIEGNKFGQIVRAHRLTKLENTK